jgi:hypothetical protein
MTKWMRVAALVLLPMMAACEDDATGGDTDDPGEEVTTIRLTMGGQSIDITNGVASGTLDIPRGQSTLTATFLRQTGTPVTLPGTGAFTLSVVSSNSARAAVTQTTPFSVTLNGLQTGAVTLNVALQHGSHPDLGPVPVSATVLAATDN